MRFLHISDTHLGYRQYGLLAREGDFWDVFDEAVEIAIDKKVDFILHSGDFFHTSRPSNETLLKAIDAVKRLKDNNIPIFSISGNHDRGSGTKDKSPLAILESVGLQLLDDRKYISFDGIGIGGIKYLSRASLRKVDFRELLEKLANHMKEDYKILLLHQEFIPYFPESDLDLSNHIPEAFNYVGIGHYHISTEPIKRNNSTILHIGSTEFTAYNPKEEQTPKRVALVETDGKDTTVNFINLSRVRPFIFEDINEEDLDTSINNILSKLENISNGKKPVLILKGILRKTTISDILLYIESKLNIEEFLIIRPNFSFVIENEEEDININSLTEREDFIKGKLKELIGDENLFNDIYSIIESLKTEEDTNRIKEEIKRIDFRKLLEI